MAGWSAICNIRAYIYACPDYLYVFTQLISINSNITIYKVFVDILSYYTLVCVFGFIQLGFQLLSLPYNHALEILTF